MATEPLPVPAQLKAQLDKCKSVRSAETYCKSRAKTDQVSFVVCIILEWENAPMSFAIFLLEDNETTVLLEMIPQWRRNGELWCTLPRGEDVDPMDDMHEIFLVWLLHFQFLDLCIYSHLRIAVAVTWTRKWRIARPSWNLSRRHPKSKD